MTSRSAGYGPWMGDIVSRGRSSMVRDDGAATSYSLGNLQQRGTLFVSPMAPVYRGMIVGEHSRPNDLPCNPTKRKGITDAEGTQGAKSGSAPRPVETVTRDSTSEGSATRTRAAALLREPQPLLHEREMRLLASFGPARSSPVRARTQYANHAFR